MGIESWVLGTSTSHWTGKIDFEKMYKAGARFWIAKATDAYKVSGVQFEDSLFDQHSQAAFSHGKLLKGCYHWLQASVDPTVAADFYLERYRRYKFDYPPILDFEEKSVIESKMFSDYAWRGQMWCKRVEEVTGRKPIIYTAEWFLYYFKFEHISWMSAYPLYIANYSWWANTKAKAPVLFPKLSWDNKIWSDWSHWQYSADGNGRGKEFGQDALDVELTYFQGDYSQLLDYLKVKPEPEPEPEPLTLESLDKRLTSVELAVFG